MQAPQRGLRSEPQEKAGQLSSQSARPMILRQAACSKRSTDGESCDTIWRSSRSLLCTPNERSERQVRLLYVHLLSDSAREIVSKQIFPVSQTDASSCQPVALATIATRDHRAFPSVLHESCFKEFSRQAVGRSYDVTANGRRFVMVHPGQQAP